MTHWTTRALAPVAQEREMVPPIAHSPVSLILRQASWQPPRWCDGKPPTLNEEFVTRAGKIPGCYQEMDRWARRGEVAICCDEKPHRQALERSPPRQVMRPGPRERPEFESQRQGTVNFAIARLVQDGRMRGWCLDKNDPEHLLPVWEEWWEECGEARRMHLMGDGGPSHRSQDRKDFLRGQREKVRVLMSPAHASWLHQGEWLLRAFSDRYLKRGSGESRQALINHWDKAWREYNQRFAHPFTWSWTQRDMRQWVKRKQEKSERLP